ncbi:hypothetical protein CPB86DRAFT_784019 [Serendipita vermifera]|nr:hypothetical protein CPB86DRAFT_784019 [Serendipita vermifera]
MLGFRAWPTPIVRPLWPFMAGGVIVWFGLSKVQAMGVSTHDAIKDPKNPYAPALAKQQGHH